jgi:hypothetical protein
MEMRLLQKKLGALLASFMTIMTITSVASGQTFIHRESATSASAEHETASEAEAAAIIRRMIERNRAQREQLQSYSVLRTYKLQNNDGEVSAEDVVRVDYRAPGEITFRKRYEHGSWIVRHLVFDRILQNEQETASGEERREAAISEENYAFVYIGEANLGSRHCYVVRAQPKRIDKYLFEGELWIDKEDYGIAKISGRPAKRVSFWISDASFVREYRKISGFWLPYRDESFANVKAHDRRILRVEHSEYTINPFVAAASSITNLREPRLSAGP